MNSFTARISTALIDGLESFSISQIATLSVLMESIGTIMEKRLSTRDQENTGK